MRANILIFLLALTAAAASPQLAWAKDIPRPSSTLVTDYAGLLSAQERAALERKLVAYNDSTSTQIAIVIDRSLEGEDLFDYSYRLADAWGIGRKGKDNGLLIYIALEERKIIIQTGYGVEGFLPDAIAKRIISTVITPAFRQQQYYRGLHEATDIIMRLGAGEYAAQEEAMNPVTAFVILLILLIAVIVFFSLIGGGGSDGGYFGGGRYDMDRGLPRRRGGWIIIPGGGGFGGLGGGGGGGGFGGFGGGGFGGGGASGGW
jgi:uncharacterized protein